MVLRTIISVNQLSVDGAVAEMCDELACGISGCSESTGYLVDQNNSEAMVMPTELSTTSKTPRTNDTVQGNLLRDYVRKLANLPNHLQLIKLCSNAGIVKTAAKGPYFTTLDDAELDQLGGLMSRVYFTSRQRSIQSGWMDPWEHKDRSSFGGGSQSPSKRAHDRVFCLVMELVPG